VPKNKGKYHGNEAATPVEATEPLRTLTDRALDALKPHARKLIALVVALAVVLIGLSIWGWYDRRRESGASARFEAALEEQSAMVIEAGSDMPPPVVTPGVPPPKTYKSEQERSEAVLAALVAMEKDYGGADVTRHSRLLKAAVLYDLGRYDECAAEYRKFVGAKLATDLLKLVAREGLGYCLEAKALGEKDAAARTAGLDAALAEYKQLQPDDKGLYRDYALFHQARILALKGDKAGAVTLYKQIVETLPGSDVAGEARSRLDALE
jgi:hypothetical protein